LEHADKETDANSEMAMRIVIILDIIINYISIRISQ